jgi:alkylation response protein AidB-like acyl-CoA dehydrogenase
MNQAAAATALIHAAQALAPQIRDAAAAIERDRRLPLALVTAMAEAGFFRMLIPAKFGGGEVAVATMIRVIEEVAKADGSAGWCVMAAGSTAVISAYLEEDAARHIYGSEALVVTGGVFAPKGQALVVEGGYRVTGRWPFGSGCEHCTWLLGGCVTIDNGTPHLLPNGTPDIRMMIFPASQCTVIDTWSVAGLRGTGSHDIAVTEVFVPQQHAVSLITDTPRQPGPLYAFPVFGLLALGIAGVALGMARGAIDTLVALANDKTPTGSRRLLSERAVVQMYIAQAEALLRAARAFLFETVNALWTSVVAGGQITLEQRALLRLAATHVASSAAQAIDLMYQCGGGTSIYTTSPLERYFRDIHAVTQHLMVAQPTYEVIGRIFLGLKTDSSML